MTKKWEKIIIRFSDGTQIDLYKHNIERLTKLIPILEDFIEPGKLRDKLNTLFDETTGGKLKH